MYQNYKQLNSFAMIIFKRIITRSPCIIFHWLQIFGNIWSRYKVARGPWLHNLIKPRKVHRSNYIGTAHSKNFQTSLVHQPQNQTKKKPSQLYTALSNHPVYYWLPNYWWQIIKRVDGRWHFLDRFPYSFDTIVFFFK